MNFRLSLPHAFSPAQIPGTGKKDGAGCPELQCDVHGELRGHLFAPRETSGDTSVEVYERQPAGIRTHRTPATEKRDSDRSSAGKKNPGSVAWNNAFGRNTDVQPAVGFK